MEEKLMSEFDRGVAFERERIFKELKKYRVEGIEFVHVRSEPGVEVNAINRFYVEELISRLTEGDK
jgi:hypothetical protein